MAEAVDSLALWKRLTECALSLARLALAAAMGALVVDEMATIVP